MRGNWATVVRGDIAWLLLNREDISSSGQKAAVRGRPPGGAVQGTGAERKTARLLSRGRGLGGRARQSPGRKEAL